MLFRSGTLKSSQGFVGTLGHQSDENTGLVYMRARYYDPAVGRFISQDTAKSGNNWFAYCGNDPVNNIDKDGKSLSRAESEFWAVLVTGLGSIGVAIMFTSAFLPLVTACFGFGAGCLLVAWAALAFGTLGAAIVLAIVGVAVIAIGAILFGVCAIIVAKMLAVVIAAAWSSIDNDSSGIFNGPGWFGNDPQPPTE